MIFIDWMRYGLISNLHRNWSPVGKRAALPSQMEFKWGYLWAEVEVLSGEVQVFLTSGMDGEIVGMILEGIEERWGGKVALVWDNASVHKGAMKEIPKGVKVIWLPPYSPELNPVERLFEEMRKKVANRVFESLGELEEALVEGLREYWEDRERVKKLCGYGWIVAQLQGEVVLH